MPSFRDGQVNLLGLTNPGVYVDNILPTSNVVGVPTNIEAMVGVGSWGVVNAVSKFDSPADCPYGTPQVRFADIATHVAAASLAGQAVNFAGVRVTDGTDTAASATISGSAGTFTARYSGTRGNQIGVTFQPTAAVGAFAAIVSFPGRQPERFDNIFQGLQSVTVVAGTGYTSVPAAVVSAPQKVGGAPAQIRPSLAIVGVPSVSAGGTGHAVNDVLTLGGGVQVKVATVTSGAVATVTVVNPGSILSGSVPAGAGTQVSSTGAGTGASFTLVWGLGPAIVVPGSGYYAAMGNPITITLSGGGGTGGSYTPVSSFWAALATAINTGTTQRGRSYSVVYTPGSSTSSPTLNTPLTFSGGTDGASGVGTQQLLGADTLPRTGMYALRGSGADSFALCDCVDTSIWAAMLSFAISENMLAVATTPVGDSISSAVSSRATQGLDDPNFWLIVGDWPTFYDSANGSRLVSPTAIAQGLLGNLSPEQSPINKPLLGISATQTSSTGLLTSDSDEATAQTGGVDVIGRCEALNEIYFSFLTGRNTSSNTAANGIEYTRLTSFLIRSLEGPATKSIVGKLQSIDPDDPTRLNAKNVLDSFFQTLVDPSSGSGGYGMIDKFATICDLTNNTPSTIQAGYLFAFCAVRYLAVVRYFVIKLAGGNNVTVTVQSTPPTIQSLAA